MKSIAAIWVDLEHSPLGTRSRLADDLYGKPVLRRTVERVLRCKRIAAVHLLCPVNTSDRIGRLVQGLPVKIESHAAGLPPYAQLVRSGRWWGLDSWRGGIGGLTVFDEDIHVEALAALAQREKAAAVVSIPAAAVVVDPDLIDALVRHYEEHIDSARMTFVQAPPGLAALVLGRDLLGELAPTGQPPGALLTYHPDRPLADLTGKEACYRASADVIAARGRLLADTRRGLDRLRALIEAGGDAWDAAQIARWLLERESLVRESFLAPTPTGIPSRKHFVDPIPTEIEIELTTENPLPNSLLRPRGHEVPPRGPIRQSVIQSIIDAIKDHDDVRIVLGGFGDPCLHPAFPEICASLRRSTVATIAVRTTGLYPSAQESLGVLPIREEPAEDWQQRPARHDGLPIGVEPASAKGGSARGGNSRFKTAASAGNTAERVESAIFDTPVDVVEVMLDAATAETYQRVHGEDAFEQALARVDRWIQLRQQRQQVRPLIVPSFIKSVDNMDDMEAFFDTWQRRLGAALITGYSHCAGQRPSRAITSMAPPQRGICRRTLSRTLILADGRMTTCDQDFAARQTIGDVGQEPFESLWNSAKLNRIRANDVSALPLCPHCDEGHRP